MKIHTIFVSLILSSLLLQPLSAIALSLPLQHNQQRDSLAPTTHTNENFPVAQNKQTFLNDTYEQHTLLIKFKPGVDSLQNLYEFNLKIQQFKLPLSPILSLQPLFTTFAMGTSDSKQTFGLERWMKITIDTNDIKKEATLLRMMDGIEDVQLNYRITLFLEPNDPYYHSSGSWGQNFQDLFGMHIIHAKDAWNITTGSSNVIVAIVDTGIEYTHEDLQDNVWINTDEIPENGIDDDHDGFIDNIYGADFAGYDINNPQPDGDPLDFLGHGSHCAGIIGATGNNGKGVVGVNWHTQLMAVKGFADNSEGSAYLDVLVNCIQWAADNGADVISNSWGSSNPGSVPVLEDVIRYAYHAGCTVVFAAGNSNMDVKYICPLYMDEVISVAATDYLDQKASFSNWGDVVSVAAPGVDILSTMPDDSWIAQQVPEYKVADGYWRLSGTSMACPHVAGLAALLLAKNHSLTPLMVKSMIMNTADDIQSSVPIGYGRINASVVNREPAEVELQDLPNHREASGLIDIRGSANGKLFQSYTLDYSVGKNSNDWHQILSSQTPVENGSLGVFDSTTLLEGYCRLRLQLFCSDGKYKDLNYMVVNNHYSFFTIDGTNTEGPWDGTSAHPFQYVMDGIDSAGSGDTVYVHHGWYLEYIPIERSIELRGAFRNTTCIHDVLVLADHVTICGLDIESWYNWEALQIYSNNNTVMGNNIWSGVPGLLIQNGVDNTIVGNTFKDEMIAGVVLYHTNRTNLTDNLFVSDDYQDYDILIEQSSDVTIHDNRFYKGYGTETTAIFASYENMTSCSFDITKNRIIDLAEGIIVECVNSNLQQGVIHQNIINTDDYGIDIFSDSQSRTTLLITENLLEENIYGLSIYAIPSVPPSSIYHNNFIDNTIQASDTSMSTWDDGYPSGGNYWSDYTGVDVNPQDGIGDTPYDIPGTSPPSSDRYPLMDRYVPYMVDIIAPSDALVGQPVTFRTNLSGGTAPLQWSWTFGDGNTSSEETPTYTYSHEGFYPVTVHVTDAQHKTTSDTILFVVAKDDLPPWLILYDPGNDGLYLFGHWASILMRFINVSKICARHHVSAIIIGNLQIMIQAGYTISPIDRVEIYIDDSLQASLPRPTPPQPGNYDFYFWEWTQRSLVNHHHTIKVVAIDILGKTCSQEIQVLRFV